MLFYFLESKDSIVVITNAGTHFTCNGPITWNQNHAITKLSFLLGEYSLSSVLSTNSFSL